MRLCDRDAVRRCASGRQMAGLRILLDTLRHVANCKAPSRLEGPEFRKLLKSAFKGAQLRRGT